MTWLRPHEARPALLTDLYQLTMGAAYAASGLAERRACFSLYFRKAPQGAAYAVACGLDDALRALEAFRFHEDELAYLASLRGSDDEPLFSDVFLARLRDLRLSIDVAAVPEGSIVFPHEPLLRVTGPLLEAQLVETLLLNVVNFQTLVASKAHRVAKAARGKPVLEFGLRRAQGPDGGLAAARAAYVGGAAATSNVLAGMRFGIPVRGTHAHAWVMAFDDELAAFRAYADAMPGNVILLVDTYDTRAGVAHAIEVGKEMRAKGRRLLGVRLDSGDLGKLSRMARAMLDEAGFPDAIVVASNDLDEGSIAALEAAGAPIGAYGVGTQLVTCANQPALGGVYKLTAIDEGGTWAPRVKKSETAEKTTLPGVQGVVRVREGGAWVRDVIHDIHHPRTDGEELLVDVLRAGARVGPIPTLDELRARRVAQLAELGDRDRVPVDVDAYILETRARVLAARETSS